MSHGIMVDPIRIISKIRNNRLMDARERLGLSARRFAEDVIKMSYHAYLQVEGLKRYPGEPLAMRISIAVGIPEDVLFPEAFKKIRTNISVRTLSEVQMCTLSEIPRHQLLCDGGQQDIDKSMMNDKLKIQLKMAMRTLTGRQEAVLKLRFGFGIPDREHTLEEIAQKFSITRERVRAIEDKALHKMRDPSRSKMFRRDVKWPTRETPAPRETKEEIMARITQYRATQERTP